MECIGVFKFCLAKFTVNSFEESLLIRYADFGLQKKKNDIEFCIRVGM